MTPPTEVIRMRRAAALQLARAHDRLEAIVAAQNDIIGRGLDPIEIAKAFVHRARAVTNADASTMDVIKGKHIVGLATAGTAIKFAGRQIASRNSLSVRCIALKEALFCDDSETDPRVDRDVCREIRARSIIIVPVIQEDRALGVLSVYSDRPAFFDDGDTQTLLVMAALLAGTLRNAAMFDGQALEIKAGVSRQAELKRSNRELEDFAYVASHDLQEPLRKIQAFGERLEATQAARLDDRGRDYITRMRDAAGRMQVLINDLMAYSRIQTRAQPFRAIQLDQIVAEVLNDLETAIRESAATIVVAPLLIIEADPLQMRQVFQNVIANAIRYRDPERAVTIDIATETAQDNTGVSVTISDNGIGFEQRHAERIFSVFERLHPRGEYGGSGVGLAICRRITDRHHGSITAVATPGVGARFNIQLPLTQEVEMPT